MEITHDFKELERRVMLGDRLTESELSALEADLSLRSMQKRGAYDFGEIEAGMGAGIEGAFLRERNARWAAKAPRRAESKGFPYDTSPSFMGPWLDSGKGGIQRMLNNFKAKLSDILETGRVTL